MRVAQPAKHVAQELITLLEKRQWMSVIA